MRNPVGHGSWIIILILSIWSYSAAQTTPDIRQLEPGKPIERGLAGGEVHAYSIQLAAGQFLGVIVDQRGIDVVVALFGPDRKQLIEVDSPNGTKGPEPVSLVAEASGSYRLEVRSLGKAAAGRYEVKIETLRVGTAQDKMEDLAAALVAAKTEEERNLLLAQEKELVTEELLRAFVGRGKRFENQGNYAQALAAYALAQNVAQKIGNKVELANALNSIAQVHEAQGNYAQSLKFFQQSLALRETLGDKSAIAESLNNIGVYYTSRDEYERALEFFRRGSTLTEDKTALAKLLFNIGYIRRVQGDHAQALEFYQKSLTLSVEAGYRAGIARTLNGIGFVHHMQGDYAQALEFYRKSLKLYEELGSKAWIANAHGNIGDVYRLRGNYAQAMEYAQSSLKLSEESGLKLTIASALNKVGLIHSFLSNHAQALEYYQKSLGLQQKLGNKAAVANGLSNIGTVHSAQGDYVQALKYYEESLKLREESKNKLGIARTLRNIGITHDLQGNYTQALLYYEKSLQLNEESGSKLGIASALKGISNIYEKQRKYPQALEAASRAAALARQIGDRERLWGATITAGIAYQALGQLTQARQAFEEAISIVELLRTDVAGQESRAQYFETVQQPYELHINLLMQLHKQHTLAGHDAAALHTAERARARSLLEALAEARADIRQGVAPALLESERALQQRLNSTAERQTRLLSGKYAEEQAAAIKKDMDVLSTEYREVQAQIRRSSPRYAALTQPVPLTLREIQQQVLDAETVLLQYALGEERSYLWAVTPASLVSFELPKRALVEEAVRRVQGLLSDGQRWATSQTISAQYEEQATRLSQMVLPAALVKQLGTKRLVIVADGALQYLPFSALPLPEPAGGRRKNDFRPLIVEHEIVSLPSSSTIAVLRRETSTRAPAAKSIAVLADPVFAAADERVATARSKGTHPPASEATAGAGRDTSTRGQEASRNSDARPRESPAFAAALERATLAVGVLRDSRQLIARLPFTRREAEAILAVAPAGEGMKALDFRANRETATSAELAQYRIVHFATHGLLNSEHPELSGIVLSLVNQQGQPVDGFLRLHDIYNLNLPADLVVLSACQTGLGKEIRGEGLIGLTRGFMYAGAPRVLASLWKVDDAATAELMKRFYRGMLKDNLRPAAALRAAKVEMWKQKRWNAPFYWAAFELQGEWK
ncbi:tetratricopeptide repeat protein [soil metagenome]